MRDLQSELSRSIYIGEHGEYHDVEMTLDDGETSVITFKVTGREVWENGTVYIEDPEVTISDIIADRELTPAEIDRARKLGDEESEGWI
jgi:hypothetical protein